MRVYGTITKINTDHTIEVDGYIVIEEHNSVDWLILTTVDEDYIIGYECKDCSVKADIERIYRTEGYYKSLVIDTSVE